MSPIEQYADRLRQREAQCAGWQRLNSRMGTLRLALAALFIVLAWACETRGVPGAWLLLPVALFAGVLFQHHRIRTALAHAERAAALYRHGIERLEGRTAGRGPTGERFSDPHHVYAADLDLFGADSLFQSMCSARTPLGEALLAHWLLVPATLETIAERQRGVAELRTRLDLREELLTLGEPERMDLGSDALLTWAGAANDFSRPWLRWAAWLLPAAAAVTALAWALWGLEFPLLAVLVLEAGISYACRSRVHAAVSGIENAYEDLKLLARLLARLERESFESPRLTLLKAKLVSEGRTASATFARLATIVNFVEARRNPLLVPLMLPLMYTLQAALAAERWRRRHGHVVADWLAVLGEIEALASLARHSFERPEDPFPEFIAGPAAFDARQLGHPLIAAKARVRNDVELAGATRVLLVSGSNMSGKSTLLRSVGINTVLAMAGAPVCAARLQLTPLMVGASIRVNDSLHAGSSRFYAEITRLRQLFEPAPIPLLFLLDELLQGTNSTDRRIGAQGVVRALLERGAIGLISTHDLALADGAGIVHGALKNVHFQDELRDGKLTFDFKLRDGIVTKSNGVELMRAIGLDV